MDGWSDFNAIPVWAGMLGLLATLVRLTVRERVVRRGIDIKTPLESESQGVGYVAPMPKDFNARFPEWHYDYDFSLNRPSSLIRWMFRVLALFLSGRKRAPQPDAELQSLSRELRRQTSQQKSQDRWQRRQQRMSKP